MRGTKDLDAVELLEREQSGAQPVVDIVIVVGDLVGNVGQLRLEARLLALDEPPPNSPSSRALSSEQCLRMPSRVSKVRFRPLKSA